MVIILSRDGTLNKKVILLRFGCERKKIYLPPLTNKALEILFVIATSCLCETGFSAGAVLKTEFRSRLVIGKALKQR